MTLSKTQKRYPRPGEKELFRPDNFRPGGGIDLDPITTRVSNRVVVRPVTSPRYDRPSYRIYMTFFFTRT